MHRTTPRQSTYSTNAGKVDIEPVNAAAPRPWRRGRKDMFPPLKPELAGELAKL